jgi:hypothetical protein
VSQQLVDYVTAFGETELAAARLLVATLQLSDDHSSVLAVNEAQAALCLAAKRLTRAVDELPAERQPEGVGCRVNRTRPLRRSTLALGIPAYYNPHAYRPSVHYPRFLDIGSGPGSKMLIAQELFCLDACGFDRVPEYVAAAAELGLNVTEADALEWGGYGDADLIWFHRPLRDPVRQFTLEQQVWKDMAPGAVVICANLEAPPAGFVTVLDDLEARRGILMKPPLP